MSSAEDYGLPTKEFRRDINGLRAYAVAAVVLYHFNVPGFRGGYIGVDVFFAISGFLMTSIIVSGLKQARGFSIWRFYLARAVAAQSSRGDFSIDQRALLEPRRGMAVLPDLSNLSAVAKSTWNSDGSRNDGGVEHRLPGRGHLSAFGHGSECPGME